LPDEPKLAEEHNDVFARDARRDGPLGSVQDLKPDPENARKHGKRNVGMMVEALQEVGAGRSIVIDEDGVILAGNGIVQAAAEAGIERVQVVEADGKTIIAVRRRDLTPEQKRRLALYDNRTAELANWDAEVLQALHQDGALSGLWTDEELGGLLDIEPDGGPDDPGPELERAEELRAKWGVVAGQVWQLGEHRLACGDCRDTATVDAATAGRKACAMWTDPPYGVEYQGGTGLRIANDNRAELPDLLRGAFATADGALESGSPIYVAHPAGSLSLVFGQAFLDVGWHFHETLVWVKDALVLGHSDYHYMHEPILYGWKGTMRRWYAGRSETSVFQIPRPRKSEDHPTMKPVELVEAHLRNSTKAGDLVWEPFGGSGTTLVACERLRRRSASSEIDPRYVAVALERWAVMTGKEPSRVG